MGTVVVLAVRRRYSLCTGPCTTSLGGGWDSTGILITATGQAGSQKLSVFCRQSGQPLLPAEPTLCANLPLPLSGAKQKAPLWEPGKISANHRRAARSRPKSAKPQLAALSHKGRRGKAAAVVFGSLEKKEGGGEFHSRNVGVRWSPLSRGGWGAMWILHMGWGPGYGMRMAWRQPLATPHVSWAIPSRPHWVGLHVLRGKVERPFLPCSVILRIHNFGEGPRQLLRPM